MLNEGLLRHCTVLKHRLWLPWAAPSALPGHQSCCIKIETCKPGHTQWNQRNCSERVVNSKEVSVQGSLSIYFNLFSKVVYHSVIQPSRSHTVVHVSFPSSPVHLHTSTGRQVNLAVSWISRKKPDWCRCSSEWLIVGSNECQCKGSRRANLPFWQQSVIRLALQFHEIVSVSYTHIYNLLESCGGWRHRFPSAECRASPGHCCCQLLDTNAGKGHELGWLWDSKIFLELLGLMERSLRDKVWFRWPYLYVYINVRWNRWLLGDYKVWAQTWAAAIRQGSHAEGYWRPQCGFLENEGIHVVKRHNARMAN